MSVSKRAAQLAGMPQSFLKIAQDTLTTLQEEAKTST